MKKSEKIAEINNRLNIAIAAEKTTLAEAEVEYRKRVTTLMAQAQIKREEAIDDPDDPQDNDQQTQWLNGEQWSCAVVARRILKKLPLLHYPEEAYQIVISKSYSGSYYLDLNYVNTVESSRGVINTEIRSEQETEKQATKVDEWITMVNGKMIEVKNAKEAENE